MEWISIKEKLPKSGERVLVFSQTIHITRYDELYGFNTPDSYIGYSCSFEATHWMKLPDTPINRLMKKTFKDGTVICNRAPSQQDNQFDTGQSWHVPAQFFVLVNKNGEEAVWAKTAVKTN